MFIEYYKNIILDVLLFYHCNNTYERLSHKDNTGLAEEYKHWMCF